MQIQVMGLLCSEEMAMRKFKRAMKAACLLKMYRIVTLYFGMSNSGVHRSGLWRSL